MSRDIENNYASIANSYIALLWYAGVVRPQLLFVCEEWALQRVTGNTLEGDSPLITALRHMSVFYLFFS